MGAFGFTVQEKLSRTKMRRYAALDFLPRCRSRLGGLAGGQESRRGLWLRRKRLP